MRHFCVGFVILTLIASTAFGSEAVDNMIKLRRAGIERDVMLAFVRTSSILYELNGEEIQKLEDNDVPATVIIAMLDHDRDLQRGAPVVVETSAQPVRNDEYYENVTTAAYAPRAEEMNVSFFYEALAPHGSWLQDREFGWVWQPTVASRDRDWRPYSQGGQWVWSDHGWYFESSYDWGWAAFHYGRWHRNDDRNWVWVPGTEWAPSWVDWRQSDTHIGWAPLPPESRYEHGIGFSFRNKRVGADFHFGLGEHDYSFVRSDRFLERDLGTVLVPQTNVTTVYNQTTVVNNTYVYNDNRIINRGVAPEIVSRATQRPVKAVQVVAMSVPEGQKIKAEERTETKIVTFKPQIANVTPVDPKAAIQRRVAERAERTQRQQEIKAEANSGTRRRPESDVKPAPVAAPVTEQDARKRLMDEKTRGRGRSNRAAPATPPVQPEVKGRPSTEAAPAGEIKPVLGLPTEVPNDARRERAIEAAKAESAKNEAAKAAAARESATRDAAKTAEAARIEEMKKEGARTEALKAETAQAARAKNDAAKAAAAAKESAARDAAKTAETARVEELKKEGARNEVLKAEAVQAERAKNEAAKAAAAAKMSAERDAAKAAEAARVEAMKKDGARTEALKAEAAQAEHARKEAAKAAAADRNEAAKAEAIKQAAARQNAGKPESIFAPDPSKPEAGNARAEAAKQHAARIEAARAEAARLEAAKAATGATEAEKVEAASTRNAAKDVKDAEKDTRRKSRDEENDKKDEEKKKK